jgi:hypothetical protein
MFRRRSPASRLLGRQAAFCRRAACSGKPSFLPPTRRSPPAARQWRHHWPRVSLRSFGRRALIPARQPFARVPEQVDEGLLRQRLTTRAAYVSQVAARSRRQRLGQHRQDRQSDFYRAPTLFCADRGDTVTHMLAPEAHCVAPGAAPSSLPGRPRSASVCAKILLWRTDLDWRANGGNSIGGHFGFASVRAAVGYIKRPEYVPFEIFLRTTWLPALC